MLHVEESDFVLPDTEKKGDESSETGEKGGGMGELGRSLEFLMLKVAQLETLAEMQQALIGKLLKKIDTDDADVSMAQKTSEESMPEAHDVLQRVLQKHAHQREHREYHPEAHQPKPNTEEAEELEEDDEEVEESPGEESPGPRRALLQKRENFFPGVPTPGLRRRVVPAPRIIPTKVPTSVPTKVPSVPVPVPVPSVPSGVPGVPGLPDAPGVPDIPQLVAAAVEECGVAESKTAVLLLLLLQFIIMVAVITIFIDINKLLLVGRRLRWLLPLQDRAQRQGEGLPWTGTERAVGSM